MKDDFSIKAHIRSTNKAMGALKILRENLHGDTNSKQFIFQAIPTNLLLWECEAWSLRETLKNKLEVFLQRHSKRILKIYMFQEKNDHIHKTDIKQRFYNILSV